MSSALIREEEEVVQKISVLTLIYLTHPILQIFSVENINLESITFMKVKIVVKQSKLYIVAKRNV